MIRFAWTQFRTQAAVGAGLLAVVAVVFAVTGIQLAHSYDAAVALCRQQGNCASLSGFFPSDGYRRVNKSLDAAALAVPGLIGMFWGAPLFAREFEAGTFRLAWTQGVTRTRWLAAKLSVAGLAAIAAAELFSLMLNWWASPIHKAGGYTPLTSGIGSSYIVGVAPAGYAAFAFAVGAAAGLFTRRTVPAMAVTLAVFAAVMTVFPIWVRPHLMPAARATSALGPVPVSSRGSIDGHLGLYATRPAGLPGAWVISTQVVAPDGRAPSSEPAGPCGASPSTQACGDYIQSLHFQQTVTYQPATRYWDFQWIETGIYLALALILAGLCFLRIRPGRPADPGIRRPRAIRPAPALTGVLAALAALGARDTRGAGAPTPDDLPARLRGHNNRA